MRDLKSSFCICRVSIRKAFFNYRLYVALIWFLLIIFSYVTSIRVFAQAYEANVALWILPFLTNETMAQLFIVIGATLLFCDAPFANPSTVFQLSRTGRKNIFRGHLMYIIIMSLIYAFLIAVVSVLPLILRIDFTTGWGKIIGTLGQTNLGAMMGIKQLDYDIIVTYAPWQAMLLSIIAIWLNAVLIGAVNYVFNLWIKRGSGAIMSIVIGLSPYLIQKLATLGVGIFLSPPAWMNISVYNWSGRGAYPTPLYIYLVLIGLSAFCFIVSYIFNRKKDILFEEEI